MAEQEWKRGYLRLHPGAVLKRLEVPCLYHTINDELYELDDTSESFLTRCNGSSMGSDLTEDGAFIKYCLEEGLLEILPIPEPVKVSVQVAPRPSLRYLELQLLHRCNLQCRHCYLGPARKEMLALEDALKIAREFSSLGGLRLLISGGEPMMYPQLREFIEQTTAMKIRRVLLTNGTLINRENISLIKVEEIQFSLDGWGRGHDALRGKGTFERTVEGICAAREAGIQISLATMIHRYNLREFEHIARFAEEIGARSWEIDVPCVSGLLKRHSDIMVPYEEAVHYLRYAFGGGSHDSSEGFACGRHLMTILPSGKAVKCGFYEESVLGDVLAEGVSSCWLKLEHIPLERLECNGCPYLEECAGGCRFRAPRPLAPDPAMCALYGRAPK